MTSLASAAGRCARPHPAVCRCERMQRWLCRATTRPVNSQVGFLVDLRMPRGCPGWVKTGKARKEQMLPASLPSADRQADISDRQLRARSRHPCLLCREIFRANREARARYHRRSPSRSAGSRLRGASAARWGLTTALRGVFAASRLASGFLATFADFLVIALPLPRAAWVDTAARTCKDR
jgi:hypothetical protein